MSVIPLSDQVDRNWCYFYHFSWTFISFLRDSNPLSSVATETQNVNSFKERCIDTIIILTPGFSAPEEELSERDIIMINRGMAIRRTSEAFPPLDVPPPYPCQWSSYPHHQSSRYLGYGGPYHGYASSPQPPGQVKFNQDLGP